MLELFTTNSNSICNKNRLENIMKIIAYYLPQFHRIKENDQWWGDGFTEWRNVKTAKPYFKGHNQPRIPLDENYYDLTEINTLMWQADLANKYGIYGFSFYHYWMGNNKQLLQKPAEILLNNKSIPMRFSFSWANHDWLRTWATKEKSLLMKVEYGTEKEWKKHFDYLLPFFIDERYIRIDNKPVFTIYNPLAIPNGERMMKYWKELALENGLEGIYFVYQNNSFHTHPDDNLKLEFECGIEYQPSRVFEDINNSFTGLIKRFTHIVSDKLMVNSVNMKLTYDYDKIWNKIITSTPLSKGAIPGGFVDWDDSPRRDNRGSVTLGVTPEKFKKYLSMQIKNAKNNYNQDIIFLFAWNEWGESGYLEPDEKNKFKMLQSVYEALKENDELES